MVKMEVGVNPGSKLGLHLWSSEDVRCVNVAGNVISHYMDKSTNNMGSCGTGNVTTGSRHINGLNQDGKCKSSDQIKVGVAASNVHRRPHTCYFLNRKMCALNNDGAGLKKTDISMSGFAKRWKNSGYRGKGETGVPELFNFEDIPEEASTSQNDESNDETI
ncbi:hypothetical protein Tco_0559143 [Tanacetum coccineum]